MESSQPLVSIVCAIRNDERFIRETLETVFLQTYPNIELIVMDGASTDGTVDIVKEYAAKHSNVIWRSEKDNGQWDALDKALALSKGKYISILCGQDGYLNKDWFTRCVEVLEKNNDVSLAWGIPFNMSEDGKLMGPHYAYAAFLQDGNYGSQTKPLTTVSAKINWNRPGAGLRLWQMAKKMTPARALVVIKSFKKKSIPQKEDWFLYWLETGRAFPEGNLLVRKDVYIKNTRRFPEEKMTNSALLDFCYNMNANGYLSYGLPMAASFGRSHIEGQALRDFDEILTANYYKKIADFKKTVKEKGSFTVIDPAGNVIAEKKISL